MELQAWLLLAWQAKAKIEEAIDAGEDPNERLQSAVAAGINEARQRSLPAPASTAAGSSGEEDSTQAASPQQQQQEPAAVGRSESHSDAEGLGEQSSEPTTERENVATSKGTQEQADLVQSGSRDR